MFIWVKGNYFRGILCEVGQVSTFSTCIPSEFNTMKKIVEWNDLQTDEYFSLLPLKPYCSLEV